jgi:hypothetical protein
MKRWARRVVYVLLALVWLLVMAFPVVAVVVATQGEIQLGEERAGRHLRLFLVQERDHQGLGLDWSTPAEHMCRQGRIIYLMWQGQGENSRYCTCFDASGSVVSSSPGDCDAP